MDYARRILLVEDNVDDVELTLRAFRVNHLANQIDVARTGPEALGLLLKQDGGASEASGPLPEIVLLDLQLPGLDGIEVLRRIRGHHRTQDLPVIVLTSSRQEEDFLRSCQLGASGYLQKPLVFARFIEVAAALGLYCVVLSEAQR